MPQSTRETDSLSSFKRILDKDKPISKKLLFFYGERRLQVLHARLRNDCSALKQHLVWKNIIEDPLCRCGEIESNKPYFFANFIVILGQHSDNVFAKYLIIILTSSFFGDNNLSLAENEKKKNL